MSHVELAPFGTLPGVGPVTAATLTSDLGLSVTVLTLGATLQRIRLADGTDVLLGLDTAEAYLARTARLGATVGRYANRLAGAAFELDGCRHQLSANEGRNTLHGGADGFERRIWRVMRTGPMTGGGVELILALQSPDGDQGFPGALDVTAAFTLRGHQLVLDYRCTTTAPTPVSLTSHGYFNLAGADATSLEDHWLTVAAEHYLPVDEASLPTGEIASVEATPFDFRAPRPVPQGIDADHPQLRIGRGYDHCFLLSGGGDCGPAAVLEHRPSGRRLAISTTEPGLQFYTGNHLDGHPHPARSGLCLETQALPDSPNRPQFPSAILRPGEVWRSTTVLDFRTAGE
jgi:aldose 1-epimerase